jgi:glycine cleavage system regulatory protein
MEDELSDEDLIVIPLPTHQGGVTYAVARLVRERDGVFAEAIVAVPETNFAPPRRVALSARSLAQLKPGAPAHRPNLYLYEGMILPAPPGVRPPKGLN